MAANKELYCISDENSVKLFHFFYKTNGLIHTRFFAK